MRVQKSPSPRREGDAVELDQEFVGDRGRIDAAGKAMGRPMTVSGSVGTGRPDLPAPERGAASAGAHCRRLRQDDSSIQGNILSIHGDSAGRDVERPRRGIFEQDLFVAEEGILEEPHVMRHAMTRGAAGPWRAQSPSKIISGKSAEITKFGASTTLLTRRSTATLQIT